jgi:hypothetical protein
MTEDTCVTLEKTQNSKRVRTAVNVPVYTQVRLFYTLFSALEF